MTDQRDDFVELVDHVAEMVEEIKLLSINLTVAHAKLRLNDNAFQTVGRSFQQLLDTAAASVEEATIVLKNARGQKLTDDEKFVGQTELDSSLEKIKKEAENIIQSVLAIKKTQRINRQV
ncbi:MAG: hypothetical protein NT028_01380 [candidate division Zixibacteria bacterium]|jgi:hypothetical protein|nr:hypothetical protein [candidate division Zixibacteria bacterium]